MPSTQQDPSHHIALRPTTINIVYDELLAHNAFEQHNEFERDKILSTFDWICSFVDSHWIWSSVLFFRSFVRYVNVNGFVCLCMCLVFVYEFTFQFKINRNFMSFIHFVWTSTERIFLCFVFDCHFSSFFSHGFFCVCYVRFGCLCSMLLFLVVGVVVQFILTVIWIGAWIFDAAVCWMISVQYTQVIHG